MIDELPRTPAHLGRSGRRLWRQIVAAWELRADELALLEAACRQRDDLARVEAELRDADAVVTDARGQVVANPLFNAARQQRLAVGRLLALLGLEDEQPARSAAGRRLAAVRWRGKRGADDGEAQATPA